METAEFYKEEIRCGWRVDEKTKRIWAVQLEMLDEVERICKKYGLKYFADSGTLSARCAIRDIFPGMMILIWQCSGRTMKHFLRWLREN